MPLKELFQDLAETFRRQVEDVSEKFFGRVLTTKRLASSVERTAVTSEPCSL